MVKTAIITILVLIGCSTPTEVQEVKDKNGFYCDANQVKCATIKADSLQIKYGDYYANCLITNEIYFKCYEGWGEDHGIPQPNSGMLMEFDGGDCFVVSYHIGVVNAGQRDQTHITYPSANVCRID